MTSVGARRLRSIERSLDPQETMLLWLVESRKHASMLDLFRSLKGRPDGAHPLYRLPEQVEAAVRRRLTAEPEKVERAVRDAVRDVAALWHLFFVLNTCVMADVRLMWAYLLLLVHVVARWSRDDLGRPSPVFEEQVRAYLTDLVVWHGVVDTISQRHFQSYDPLLPEARKQLDDLRKFAEDQLVRFNDHLAYLVWKKNESGKRTPKLPEPIEWETLRAELADQAAAQVSLLVDIGRAEACEMMGEDRRATAFRERHL